jgi:Excreted virulence factor EspC, type VII ESX diderm
MTESLFVQTDGVLSYADIHDRVASGLSQLIGTGPAGAADVRATHGSIAAAVDAALSGVLGTRQGTMQTTATSGTTIGEILRNAARLYDEGDLQGAEKLRAAAEAMGGGAGASGGAAGSAPDIAPRPAPTRPQVDESAL